MPSTGFTLAKLGKAYKHRLLFSEIPLKLIRFHNISRKIDQPLFVTKFSSILIFKTVLKFQNYLSLRINWLVGLGGLGP